PQTYATMSPTTPRLPQRNLTEAPSGIVGSILLPPKLVTSSSDVFFQSSPTAASSSFVRGRARSVTGDSVTLQKAADRVDFLFREACLLADVVGDRVTGERSSRHHL